MKSPTLADLAEESTWLEWRSLIPAPVQVTELVTTEETRREFLEGARLLRMDKRPRGGDRQPGPSPLQLNIADMLNAGRKFNGILEPRRSTKTTAIQAVILGRCSLREDYLAGWTMTKKDGGQKTGERFRKDIVMQLDRLYPDPKTRPFIVNTGKGTEHIRWPHGSFFNAYAPGNEAFTSGAYDIAWVDEAQDATPQMTEDLMTSIPPTLDGRVLPQMVGSGTAPDYQQGNLLWQLLTMQRAGVIRHGVEQDIDPAELEAWEPTEEHPLGHVRELIELHHPGIGFTTPLSDVEDNFNAMTSKAFQREYLSLPGEEGSATTLIKQPVWTSSVADMPFSTVTPPPVLAMAVAIHKDGAWASIAIAWKGKKDRRHVALIHHQEGTEGFRKQVLLKARSLRRRVVYDEGRPTETVEISPLLAGRPPIQARALRRADIPRAAVLFMKTLNAGDLVHYGQDPLDRAAELAVRRGFGTSGAWAFGIPDERNAPEGDVTPLEACSRALYALDDEKAANTRVDIVGN
ncbi:hypothetical protein [Microbacterium dauci]|uniref:Phage terminase-like protein, large subunit, contains N-terminal HTH domain n=1 Tax=Microbacterium dauci TaxID=3048008 RepID=A0ABT6ZGW7_9MICO|nr:hypothetical protein [Microbacterium sp. LX3-4]MDJ1115392.1 hypothetical protein [Microbacterium sp. LX3-4]